MAKETHIQALLKPENLRSVKGLALLARMTVAGLQLGLNRSRRTGAGQEFSQYRNYQPGDDLRNLDWKMYARSERLYVRESEIETNTIVQFIVDTSASMRHEEDRIQKIDYARYLVATLAWLAQEQGDEIGLYTINDAEIKQFPAKKGRGYFQRFLYQLVKIKATGKFPKGQVINEILPQPYKRQIIVFITDMYEGHNEISKILKQLKHPKNDVILFQLLSLFLI